MIQDIVISRAKNGWVVNVRTDRMARMCDGRYEPEILTHVASTDRALVSEVKSILREGVMEKAAAQERIERRLDEIKDFDCCKQPTCLLVDEPAEKP